MYMTEEHEEKGEDQESFFVYMNETENDQVSVIGLVRRPGQPHDGPGISRTHDPGHGMPEAVSRRQLAAGARQADARPLAVERPRTHSREVRVRSRADPERHGEGDASVCAERRAPGAPIM